MRDFLLVFKTLYRDQNAKIEDINGKKKLSQKAVATLALIPLLLILVIFIVFISMNLHDIQSLSVVANIIMTAAQLLTLFLSLASILSTLYSGKDTPLLSSLPIKPTSVFFAKFALVYINALKFSASIFTPMILAMTITFNVVNKTMFYGAYPLLLLALLILPILPLFIVTLFSMPAVWIGSYFRGKSTLKSVLTIIFYCVIMALYMVLIYFVNTGDFSTDQGAQLTQNAVGRMGGLATVMYPNKVLLQFVYGIEFGKSFGISMAITLGMLALMLLLSLVFYRKIQTRRMEVSAKNESISTTLKQSSIVSSLVKRDLKAIMRNSTIAMSSFANLFLAPLFLVLMYFIMNKQIAVSAKPADDTVMLDMLWQMMNIGFAMMFGMVLFGGGNMLAILAYTREGRSFFASKALPISAKDSIKAKLFLACIAPAIMMIPVMLIILLLYKIDIVSTLMLGINIMLVVVGASSMNIVFDMRKGNMHWKDASELRTASKSNTYQIISALATVVPALIIFLMGILLATMATSLGIVVVKVIFWSVSTACCVIICVLGLYMLKNYGEKYYEIIGEHRPRIKSKRDRQLYW